MKEEVKKILKKVNIELSEEDLHKFKVMSNDLIDKMIFKHFKRIVYTLSLRNNLKISNEYITQDACYNIVTGNLQRLYAN